MLWHLSHYHQKILPIAGLNLSPAMRIAADEIIE
jgi:hypothetical protein